MITKNHIDDRFKLAMIPACLMGVLTNIYILILLVVVGINDAMASPAIGALVFLICFFLLKSNKVKAKLIFLIAAYTVAIEACIHTYFIGWDSGFFYFMFLLPIVFLLNSSWKLWMIVLFNASIIIITGVLRHQTYGLPGDYYVSPEVLEYINFINVAATGLVVIVVMIYFSRTINKKEEALIEVNFELERQNREILEQHEHQKILVKEIHHRVKNNLQIISSLMSLQRSSVEDQEVVAVLDESKRRVEAIALIHQKLYQNDRANQVNFNSYLDELLTSQQEMSADVKCSLEADEAILSLDVAVPLGLIISEMITNSFKHAFQGIEHPELNVGLTRLKDNYELVIEDNGVGLPADFDLNEPTSLGTEIIVALTDQIDAEIEYSKGQGAKFTIHFHHQLK